MGVRLALVGVSPIFPMPDLPAPSGQALAGYVAIGALVGVASVYVTKLAYFMEDMFEKLPIHWMWWPALGAVAVGIAGVASPHTMGVGYDKHRAHRRRRSRGWRPRLAGCMEALPVVDLAR
jgi:H+/Cl- antiporter ClcA